MSLQIDIAKLLTYKAGEHLAAAQTFSKKGKQPDVVKESEECIQATIIFQSAMEAVITEEIENEVLLNKIKKENELLYTKFKSLSFKNKWEKTFDELKIQNKKPLEEYFYFYSRYRVPITHPKSRYISLEEYHFVDVERGIKSGWEAMQILFKALHKKTTSWKDFCREVELST